MSLLFPRYHQQRSLRQRISLAPRGLEILSLLAVFAMLCIGVLGYPQAAWAQNEAPGSQPAVAPVQSAPEGETKAANSPKATGPKVVAPSDQTPPPETSKIDPPKAGPAPPTSGAKTPPPSVGGKSYIIGVNDVLSVSVWNQPQISRMVDVHLDGMISLPLVDEIKAEGLTQSQLKDAITRRLEDVLTAPEVDVSVLKINSKHYHVYGGVMRPGDFVLAEKVTIMDALSLTGFKDFSKPNKIEIRRGKQKFLFNYKDYIKGKNMDKNSNLELQDGDEIIVPE